MHKCSGKKVVLKKQILRKTSIMLPFLVKLQTADLATLLNKCLYFHLNLFFKQPLAEAYLGHC